MTLVIRNAIGWAVLVLAAYLLDRFWHPSPYFLTYVAFGLFFWWIPDLGRDLEKIERKLDAISKGK